MKLKQLLLPLLALSAFASVTFGIVVYNSYEPKLAAVYAEEEPAQNEENSEEETTEQEVSKWREMYETAIAKYEEIKNKQVAGTTIGALVGAIVGAVVSFIPAMLNRSNIHGAIDNLSLARGTVDAVHTELVKFKEDLDIKDKKFDQVIEITDKTSKSMEKLEGKLQKALEDNASLHAENAELKSLILDLFGNSEVLVALGVSETILKKYMNK